MISKNKERKLVDLYPHTEDSDIAKILGVSLWVVRATAENLGLEKERSNAWSDSEIGLLAANYTKLTNAELAASLGRTKMEIEHFAFRLGLVRDSEFYLPLSETEEERALVEEWNEEYNRKDFGYSRGNYVLGKILQHLFPHSIITAEYAIGKLRLDFFIQRVQIGFEFDGIQHREFNKFFYDTKADFLRAQVRDFKKSELCENMGIGVVRFSDKEKLSFGLVRRKIEEVV